MSRVIRKRALDRRAFLRGSGVAMALPFLDAMVPALTHERSLAPPARRVVYVFAPNGMVMDAWSPKGHGRSLKLSGTLSPLKPHAKDVNVLSGLALDGGRSHGDGPGDHARCVASFLTSAHPRKTGGADLRAGVSIDQVIAKSVGQETAFRSLELGMEGGRRAGSCDSGYSCAYSNNISWKSPGSPVPKAVNPRRVFERLFGDPSRVENESEKQRRQRTTRSILDAVLEDAKSLTRRLGKDDADKVDSYLTSIRAIERRLNRDIGVPVVELPDGLRDDASGTYPERLDLMYDLITLALRSDLTRTVTFMLGNAGSNRSYRFLDVPDGHHRLSHHGRNKSKLAKLRRINRFHVEHLSRFLQSLSGVTEGRRSILHNSLVLFGSGLADSDRHAHHDLPILTAGQLGGSLKTGRHLSYPRETPLANLHVDVLRRLGIKQKVFADSTGGLKGL